MNKRISIAVTIAFLTGYFVSDVINSTGISFFTEARADIDGMDYYDLKNDYDFKRAVMSIAEEECKTDIRRSDGKTWFYCGSNSRFAP
jgi:hypothetical protein